MHYPSWWMVEDLVEELVEDSRILVEDSRIFLQIFDQMWLVEELVEDLQEYS